MLWRILAALLSVVVLLALVYVLFNFSALLLPWRVLYVAGVALLAAAAVGTVRRLQSE